MLAVVPEARAHCRSAPRAVAAAPRPGRHASLTALRRAGREAPRPYGVHRA